jgi:hypothetical protein
MNDFEKDIKRAYKQGTQNAADKKGEVWDAISCELEKNKMSKNNKRTNKIGIIAVAAAALIIVLAAFTPAGQAAVAKILDMFAPEKEVQVTLEGMTEENEYQLHTPSYSPTATLQVTPENTEPSASDGQNTTEAAREVTYAIYIDESRYISETVDGVDIIKPIDYSDDLPEVSMSIYQDKARTPDELKAEIKASVEADYDTVMDFEQAEYPLLSWHIHALDGDLNGDKEDMPQWDSDVTDIYIVDNTQGGTFVITLKYFMEASEGHGERLKGMLQDMSIIPVQ